MTGAVLLALAASLLLGTSDFLGGLLSRRTPLIVVLLGSQLVVGALLSLALLVEPYDAAAGDAIAAGIVSGASTAIALAALFRGLAIGTMGVVAPVSALAVIVPVALGIAQGDPVGGMLGLGLLLAIAGTVLASGPELRAGRRAALSLALGGIAALGFGVSQAALGIGSAESVVTTLLTHAATVIGLLIVAFSAWVHVRLRGAAGRLRSGRAASPALLPARITGRDAAAIVVTGVLVAGANLAFAVATTAGALSTVAVLAALYPVVTVVLARQVLGERVRRAQLAGVVLALVGVGLIAAGG
ncbi:hypothetical protein OVN18_02415 [Microcella daejeonensis]|uniref:EamA domain-containing protein n=1 Tax=Microcella daejeonensis TaxID=2994971 RepID=A0A9E8MLU5_9MICO|nr:hypothetical protein [Microcella daejeonensis]WAB81896.1 hypothetical protein OVN18_02415 [Microcella daejeonensis]